MTAENNEVPLIEWEEFHTVEADDEAEPTPGPWECRPYIWDHGASLAIVARGFIVARIPYDPDIQVASELDGDNVVRHPCDAANGRLLAAAPAMLLALRAARDELESGNADILALINDAIATATGGVE